MKKLLLLVSCLLTISAFANGLPTTPYIYVVGTAETKVTPDAIKLSFSVISKDVDPAKAKAAASEKSVLIFKMLTELGIKDEAVTADEFSIRPDHDYTNGNRIFVGYEATRGFAVELTDFSLYPKLVDGLATLRIDSLDKASSLSSQAAAEKKKLRIAALAQARQQAEEIAVTLGAKVKSVYAASPIEFGDIERSFFDRNYLLRSNSVLRSSESFTDKYIFQPITLSERLHVIFLIEPTS